MQLLKDMARAVELRDAEAFQMASAHLVGRRCPRSHVPGTLGGDQTTGIPTGAEGYLRGGLEEAVIKHVEPRLTIYIREYAI